MQKGQNPGKIEFTTGVPSAMSMGRTFKSNEKMNKAKMGNALSSNNVGLEKQGMMAQSNTVKSHSLANKNSS